jgi:hypothetical protein
LWASSFARLSASCAKSSGCGRDRGHPLPHAQIRTCRITAYGSCLRYLTQRSAPLGKGAYF